MKETDKAKRDKTTDELMGKVPLLEEKSENESFERKRDYKELKLETQLASLWPGETLGLGEFLKVFFSIFPVFFIIAF